jgi:hypothetical protein
VSRAGRFLLLLAAVLLPGIASPLGAADAPARKAEPPKLNARAAEAGKWRLTVERGSDGSNVVTAKLAADTPIQSGFTRITPMLVLRYKAGRTSAYVAFDTYLGEGNTAATVGFGRQPPETQQWTISGAGRSAFVPGDALGFIQRLKAADTLTVRVTPYHASPVTTAFTVTGIDTVMKALFAAGIQ